MCVPYKISYCAVIIQWNLTAGLSFPFESFPTQKDRKHFIIMFSIPPVKWTSGRKHMSDEIRTFFVGDLIPVNSLDIL